MCPDDWAEMGGDVTSEIDWMRFWWQFLTSEDGSLGARPSMWEVLRLISFTHDQNPWTPTVVWPSFLLTLQDAQSMVTQHSDRFEMLGAANGVNP
jgi:hypothetical protein